MKPKKVYLFRSLSLKLLSADLFRLRVPKYYSFVVQKRELSEKKFCFATVWPVQPWLPLKEEEPRGLVSFPDMLRCFVGRKRGQNLRWRQKWTKGDHRVYVGIRFPKLSLASKDTVPLIRLWVFKRYNHGINYVPRYRVCISVNKIAPNHGIAEAIILFWCGEFPC